jgi:hypothetical protein
MAEPFQLLAIGLPAGLAPEAVPQAVAGLMASCWPGMSRAQLLDRARRQGLRVPVRLLPGRFPDTPTRMSVRVAPRAGGDAVDTVELIAHVRRVAIAKRRRRGGRCGKPSLPPARDPRQLVLF